MKNLLIGLLLFGMAILMTIAIRNEKASLNEREKKGEDVGYLRIKQHRHWIFFGFFILMGWWYIIKAIAGPNWISIKLKVNAPVMGRLLFKTLPVSCSVAISVRYL